MTTHDSAAQQKCQKRHITQKRPTSHKKKPTKEKEKGNPYHSKETYIT